MIRIRVFIILCVAASILPGSNAQTILTKEEAVARLLENNFNIQLSENAVNLAKVNADKANVGFYPVVQLNAGANGDYGSANQTFQDGREIQADANLTQVYNASVGVNYNIYQGGERKENLNRLFELVNISELQKQLTIESSIIELISTYYEAARALETVDLQEELLNLSRERLDRMNTSYDLGRSSSLDVSNAKVDYKRDEANLINARMVYDQAKRNLNQLMGIEGDIDYDVETMVNYDLAVNIDALINSALERNVQLALLDGDKKVMEYDQKVLDAQRRPILGFNTDYSYSFQDFGEGAFFAQQSSNGLGAGLNLSWNIYDGGRIKNREAALRVQMEANRISRRQAETEISNRLQNLYYNYQTALELAQVEKENIEAAQLAFDKTRNEYQLGRLGQIEFRQAQINLLNAQVSESTSRYNAKVLEIQIMQLSGQLLDEDYEL
ncbi:MAG: TolC family protein [Saprospiraceae bacterium]|nr:TolC family protein [Saprospiraceae bacterium]